MFLRGHACQLLFKLVHISSTQSKNKFFSETRCKSNLLQSKCSAHVSSTELLVKCYLNIFFIRTYFETFYFVTSGFVLVLVLG